jgi:hypothetical protein
LREDLRRDHRGNKTPAAGGQAHGAITPQNAGLGKAAPLDPRRAAPDVTFK